MKASRPSSTTLRRTPAKILYITSGSGHGAVIPSPHRKAPVSGKRGMPESMYLIDKETEEG